MAEVDEIIKRIQGYKGVMGILIFNNEGIPVKTTMDHENTVHITCVIHDFVHKARIMVKELDSQNELVFLRLRSRKHEIMCATENDYAMVVVQSPCITST